ncbi:hypothetical protein [Streptomyces sp. NPDC056056]|uniref:hypothetical protein n=1 Tax=Streptomyces sp. NPDC056056 TaxID=3345698 RepID=UPI0035E0000C
MTQPTDRPGIDQLTSDQLDQLYARLDKAERAVNLLADSHRRAEQAEATLTAVRDELTAIEQTHDALDCECEAEASAGTIRRIRAVLDQHGQTAPTGGPL